MEASAVNNYNEKNIVSGSHYNNNVSGSHYNNNRYEEPQQSNVGKSHTDYNQMINNEQQYGGGNV